MRIKVFFGRVCLSLLIPCILSGCGNRKVDTKATLDSNYYQATRTLRRVAAYQEKSSTSNKSVLQAATRKLAKRKEHLVNSHPLTSYPRQLIEYDSKVLKVASIALAEGKEATQINDLYSDAVKLGGQVSYQHGIDKQGRALSPAVQYITSHGYVHTEFKPGLQDSSQIRKHNEQLIREGRKIKSLSGDATFKHLEASLIILSLILVLCVFLQPSKQGMLVDVLSGNTAGRSGLTRKYGLEKVLYDSTITLAILIVLALVMLNKMKG